MDVTHRKAARRRLRTSLFAAIAVLVVPSLRAADPKIAFDIPAGEFTQAIIEFYKQTQVEILYASPGSVDHLKTRAVSGELDVVTALTKMLEGTGFTFEFENARSVLLKRAAEPSALGSNTEVGADVEASGSVGRSPGYVSTLAAMQASEFQDVVVTGSLIRGVLDITSPLVRITKKEMRSTAYATVHDALQALPSNAGGGFSDDFTGNSGNYNRGTSPNLRGLGYGATLVLVNGRRQPLAGSAADFVDLSNIPWNVVERIEVLPDGTSALYGSDAIAGVVNIITRENLDGAETQGRFASGLGGGDEKVFAQMFGTHWDTGRWLASYQFSERSALAASDRRYTANADKRSLGGSDHRSFWGNPGNILDPGTLEPIFAIPRGQDGTMLSSADLLPGANRHNTFATYDLAPRRQMHSFLMNGAQHLSDRIELYGEARLSERRAEQREFQLDQLLVVPASNPFFLDAYGGLPFVLMAYSFDNDLGPIGFHGKTLSYDLAMGLRADLGRAWHVDMVASYGREDLRWTNTNMPNLDAVDAALADSDPRTAFNPFGDGSFTNAATIEAIRSKTSSQITSDIKVASFVADGPLLDLPTGALKAAFGVEARQEALNQRLSDITPARFGRDIASVFAELSLPLIGGPDDPRLIPRLELSLAGRYEKYSDFGQTFNPKIGLRWVPLPWAKLRGSWGTSFKAPKLLDLYDTSQNAAALIVLADPKAVNGQSPVLVRQGNNANLKQETAETWTVGIDFMPTISPGLTVSLTYYDINYEDRILIPGPSSPFGILMQEQQWAGAITRNPSRQQIDEICNGPDFFGSASDCLNSLPAAIVDFRLRNLAITSTRGVDLKLDYALDTQLGAFDLALSGNQVFAFDQALSSASERDSVIDTVGNPLSFRIRASAEWEQHGRNQHGFNAGTTLDHTGGYRDINASFASPVDAFTTLDLRLGYRPNVHGGWMGNSQINLSVVNVFNAAPPFIDRNFGYDVQNSDPIGRIVAVYIEKSW